MRDLVNCACCGTLGPHKARGWVAACYQRWWCAGKPRSGPPPRRIADRIEDYVELTRERGLTRELAAERIGVTRRTAERYEARIRDRAQQEVA